MSPKVIWIGILRTENSTVTQLPSIYWGTLSASIVCSTSLIPREKFIAISHPVTCHELGHGEGRHQAARSERVALGQTDDQVLGKRTILSWRSAVTSWLHFPFCLA